MNTRENYYMDAVAGRYERVFPVARYADVIDLAVAESVRASLAREECHGPGLTAKPGQEFHEPAKLQGECEHR